jgi:hypothetical protein
MSGSRRVAARPADGSRDNPCVKFTFRLIFAGQAAGELACRPGSVHPLTRAGGHPSRTAITDSLMRFTSKHRAGHPQALAQARAPKDTHRF